MSNDYQSPGVFGPCIEGQPHTWHWMMPGTKIEDYAEDLARDEALGYRPSPLRTMSVNLNAWPPMVYRPTPTKVIRVRSGTITPKP